MEGNEKQKEYPGLATADPANRLKAYVLAWTMALTDEEFSLPGIKP